MIVRKMKTKLRLFKKIEIIIFSFYFKQWFLLLWKIT